MTTERQLGNWCKFHFETGEISVPSISIINTGNLRSLFREADEYEMNDVDETTGRVFAHYITSRRYDIDYETAARDQRMALREYMTALKAWALGRRYNLYGLVVLAREHAVDLSKLVNPMWVLEATIDTPLAMKHIDGIIHRIDDLTSDLLNSTTERLATGTLLHMSPPTSVGRLWVMLQFMLKARGPALRRGRRLVAETLPDLLPGMEEYLEYIQRVTQQNEGIDPGEGIPFEEDVAEHASRPYASGTCAVYFANKGPLHIPNSFLNENLKRYATFKVDESSHPSSELRLDSIMLDAGHVIIHYLVTGSYQCLQPQEEEPDKKVSAELSTAIRVYVATGIMGLPQLREMTRAEIVHLGDQLSLPVLITVMEAAALSFDSYPGIAAYVESRVL
ncbi:hypothetical protein FGADI_10968 [Fusarium gaditjirri]|uniref:Uncharacterized protein n=1 Tax=Fusarium gaditjirri TaxID=282569 RepID=A0A8H4SVV9_9HYPO|nr:hypothetical protein FGADI_10968 [Fusarium gaditjirri]